MSKPRNRTIDKNNQFAVNNLLGLKPVDTTNAFVANMTCHYREKLFRMIYSLFEVEGAPEDWDIEYLLETILNYGYIGIIKTNNYGVIPYKCAPWGLNLYGKPTELNVASHVAGIDGTYTIGRDAVLVKLQNNMCGVGRLIDTYATKLASIDGAIETNLINSKLAYIFNCSTNAQEATCKVLYDGISRGEPAVFIRAQSEMLGTDGSVLLQTTQVKQNYIVNDLQDAKRTFINEFLTDIGINNANTDKKERVITPEANSNNQELENNVTDWYRNVNAGFERSNDLFDTNLRLRMKFYEELERGADATTQLLGRTSDTA